MYSTTFVEHGRLLLPSDATRSIKNRYAYKVCFFRARRHQKRRAHVVILLQRTSGATNQHEAARAYDAYSKTRSVSGFVKREIHGGLCRLVKSLHGLSELVKSLQGLSDCAFLFLGLHQPGDADNWSLPSDLFNWCKVMRCDVAWFHTGSAMPNKFSSRGLQIFACDRNAQ